METRLSWLESATLGQLAAEWGLLTRAPSIAEIQQQRVRPRHRRTRSTLVAEVAASIGTTSLLSSSCTKLLERLKGLGIE